MLRALGIFLVLIPSSANAIWVCDTPYRVAVYANEHGWQLIERHRDYERYLTELGVRRVIYEIVSWSQGVPTICTTNDFIEEDLIDVTSVSNKADG